MALNTWANLLDSVSHVGPLTSNPMEGRALHSKDEKEDRRTVARGGKRRNKRRKKKRKQKVG